MKKIISLFITILFLSVSIVYGKSYGESGYWEDQLKEWTPYIEKNNMYVIANQTGNVVGNQDPAIYANLLSQTPKDLNKTPSDRSAYLQLFDIMLESMATSGIDSDSMKAQSDQFLDKYKEICADATIKSKEKTQLQTISKSFELVKNGTEAKKIFENMNNGQEYTEEQVQGAAEATQDLNNDYDNKVKEKKLAKRGLGYVESNSDVNEQTIDTTMTEADQFIDLAKDNKIDQSKLAKIVKSLYNALLAVAIVAAVIIGTYMAVKLITSSVEGQAKIKEMFIPYIIGCVGAFGAFGIWALVMKIFNAM